MELDKFTVYCITGFTGLVTLSVLYLIISESVRYKAVVERVKPFWRSIVKRTGYILLGFFFIGLGVDFLLNPVHYSARAQYDLRGWTKYLAALVCFLPGVYSVIVGLTPVEKAEGKTQ